MSIRKQKNKRPYRKVNAATVARHQAMIIKSGNGTAAIRDEYDDYDAPQERSRYILSLSDTLAPTDYIENGLQQISKDAMQTIGNSVISDDEAIALRASQYVIDHLRGKAVQRSESKNLNISIESVL